MTDRAFLSREYNNRELFPDHARHFARWAETSARARRSMTCYLDRAYGASPGETLDIFPSRQGDGSALMFIHGGYWRSLDKKDFSFLAPAWVDAGVSLVVVNYDLCPKVSVERIVQQMLAASVWLYRHAEQYVAAHPQRVVPVRHGVHAGVVKGGERLEFAREPGQRR